MSRFGSGLGLVNTFLQIKLLGFVDSFFYDSDKVSEFRQTVRQLLSGIHTINCLADPLDLQS